uniref:Eukaryotic elongation factor, selenocysteine-tRNA-specific n=1 Tax=Cyprinus carpio TaxID=7962 RepID=A0A8C2PTZ9_CYPCA
MFPSSHAVLVMAESSPPNTLNFNVGVLGHVDSGKTSFARAAFTVPLPEHLRESCGDRQYDSLQFTLVDCTGHASLIRTIIGSAQIIDLRMLVVDVVKGMQTQTAECLLIGQLTCSHTIVILNKTDLLPSCPIIAVAAKPGGPEFPETDEPQGITGLIDLLKAQAFFPHRDPSGSLLMAVDHCFSIRGQGTVITGNILQGSLSVNDTVEIPALKVFMYFYTKLYNTYTTNQNFGVMLPRNENGDCSPTSQEERADFFSFDWEFHHLDEYLTCQTEDIHGNTCRLAFHGKLLEGFEDKNYTETALPRLKISKDKQKEGAVERVTDDYTVIGRNLFKKETNLQLFVGLKVTLSTGEMGSIEGGFGQSGKIKIRIPEGLKEETKQLLSSSSKKKGKGGAKNESSKLEETKPDAQPVTIYLNFKRYIYDPHKKMVQS